MVMSTMGLIARQHGQDIKKSVEESSEVLEHRTCLPPELNS